MKCVLCRRHLNRATVTTTGPDGQELHYGPICALTVMVKPARAGRPTRLPRAIAPASPRPRKLHYRKPQPGQLLLAFHT